MDYDVVVYNNNATPAAIRQLARMSTNSVPYKGGSDQASAGAKLIASRLTAHNL